MFCRFCGGQIPDEAVFCPDCGKQLCTDTKSKQTARQRQSHVTLPSNWNITQAQFDALVQDAMHGEILGQ